MPSLEQKNKLTKKVWMQEELAKMEQMLVRLKVRESHQPIAKDTSSKSKLTPEKEQRTIKSNDSSQLSHEKDFKETFQEVPKENPIIVDHIKDDGIEKSPKVSSQKRSKSSSKSDALSESVVPVQSRSPWLTTHSASMVKDQAADNGKSISAMGENGRTVLSPPSTCPSTPTATPKTANAFSNKKPQPVSTTSEPEDSRKVVVNLFDLITQKKGKEAPKQVNTPIAAAAAWSGNSKPLVSQIVTPTTAPMISKSNKQSLADIQAQEEEERRNSRMTNLKGNDIPWHIERKPRAISFDRVIVEQVSQQHEDVELEEALRMIAEMEAREAADAQRSQKQRKQGQQHHNKQPRHSTQSQNKSKPKASN